MRYAEVLKTMYFCAFYSPILPVGVFWALGSLFLTYWTDKVNKICKFNYKCR